MPFWTRRRYFFFAVPELGFKWCLAAFSASPGSAAPCAAPCFLSMYWGSGALFFFLGGSKGAVLDPPQVLFFAVPELGFKCVWLFRMRCRGAAFSASPGSAAPCFLSMYWGSFLLLRGFQRCRSGPAAGTFFLLCLSSDLSGAWLFRMHCRGAALSASPGSAAPCVLSMYWGSFLLLRGFQRCRSGPAAGTVFCCAGARF